MYESIHLITERDVSAQPIRCHCFGMTVLAPIVKHVNEQVRLGYGMVRLGFQKSQFLITTKMITPKWTVPNRSC